MARQPPVPPAGDTTDDARWAAVGARDPRADGTFLYGVVTTGVFCRPSCPSRRARRENVRFFDTAEQARAAGLRPCRRCDPTGPGPAARQRSLVTEACRVIDQAPEPPTVAAVAAAVGTSPFHLHRLFKALTGVTPKAYGDARRAERARGELGRGAPVSAAVYAAGFGSPAPFYAAAPDRLGMTPARYRAGAAGEEVRVAVAPCSLGTVLVAATDRGVCDIQFGDDAAALVRGLQDRLHAARFVGDHPGFSALVARVVALVEDPGAGTDLPLDIRGTAFQERVWQALQDVRAGQTVTYAELARRVGEPRAARAVAGACAANRLAVAIPCHRVIRGDGSLSGYRWGVARKAALLGRELPGPVPPRSP